MQLLTDYKILILSSVIANYKATKNTFRSYMV